ncbi:hypothetical protein [Paenibacillus sp. Lou8.1]|uniref:hypothetical protein n=1 Tax=Paenibacillus sp. Lou8.1 TaxID=2962041 RepID=UPI0020B72CEC|nr:hypothetical protein [Paenibacillus sp. Lou8.1]
MRAFKKHLREKGAIGNRQQFSNEHIKLFESIRDFKNTNHTTWEVAFVKGINTLSKKENRGEFSNRVVIAEQTPSNLEETLYEILKTLKNIEAKL